MNKFKRMKLAQDIYPIFEDTLDQEPFEVHLDEYYSITLLNREEEKRNISSRSTNTNCPLTSFKSMFDDAIRDLLAHIQASPDLRKLFKSVYAFPSSEEIPSGIEPYDEKKNSRNVIGEGNATVYPNLTEEHIEEFVKEICGLAHLIREDPRRALKIGRHLFIGRPGNGKTFFINYFQSVFAEYMRNNDVIWVRADLTKTIFEDLPIHNRLNHQILKIITKWYTQKHNISVNNQELIKFIYKETSPFVDYKHEDEKSETIVSDLKDIINYKYNNEAFPKNKHYRYDYAIYLIKYLKEKEKCAFIFFLDGLDIINPDDKNIGKYKDDIKKAAQF